MTSTGSEPHGKQQQRDYMTPTTASLNLSCTTLSNHSSRGLRWRLPPSLPAGAFKKMRSQIRVLLPTCRGQEEEAATTASNRERLGVVVEGLLGDDQDVSNLTVAAAKAILFEGLAAFLGSVPSANEGDGAADGANPPPMGQPTAIIIIACAGAAEQSPSSCRVRAEEGFLRLAAGPREAAVENLRALVAKGSDCYALLVPGGQQQAGAATTDTYLEDHQRLPPLVKELHLVPLHAVPPPAFGVSFLGSLKKTDAFGKDYTAYEFQIVHGDLTWRIAKRFSEFARLHDRLWQAEADDHDPVDVRSLPPLPSRRLLALGKEEATIVEERSAKLEEYLRALVALPQAFSNVHVLSFLGIMSSQRMELPLADPADPARKRQVLHVKALPGMLEYGDIILFRCAHVYAGLQRAATRAEWDHVAIAVSSPRRPDFGGGGGVSLDLLESTGEGVTCYPLMARIEAYATEFTSYIGVRKLRGPRTAAARDRLQAFARRVDGKPYGFSLRHDLFPKKHKRRPSASASGGAASSSSPPPAQPAAPAAPGLAKTLLEKLRLAPAAAPAAAAEADKGKTDGGSEREAGGDNYFCSQLVAAALQAVGALPPEHYTGYYWPPAFAQGGDVDKAMVGGWALGDVCLLDTKHLELGTAALTRRP